MEQWPPVAEKSSIRPHSAIELQLPAVAGVMLEPVPLATFRPQFPVPVSLYLRLDEDMVLCRQRGELLDAMLRRHLLEVGKDRLWTPATTRYEYLSHLQQLVIDLLLERLPDDDRSDQPLTWLQPWISRLNRSTPQQIERAWRTAFYGVRLAESAGLTDLMQVREIAIGLLLHEVGAGPIDDEQIEAGITATSIIEGCRERIDGHGPRGWAADQLTLPVRIACVAVAFDEKTTGADDRCRQPAFDALRDFIVNDHGALDPRVIAGFIRVLDR
ncbi:MAG: hypothetical protein VX764_06220 [Planctomycetota bacterium]|nr:hypothetical protein [Planctomycetota bacterium]